MTVWNTELHGKRIDVITNILSETRNSSKLYLGISISGGETNNALNVAIVVAQGEGLVDQLGRPTYVPPRTPSRLWEPQGTTTVYCRPCAASQVAAAEGVTSGSVFRRAKTTSTKKLRAVTTLSALPAPVPSDRGRQGHRPLTSRSPSMNVKVTVHSLQGHRPLTSALHWQRKSPGHRPNREVTPACAVSRERRRGRHIAVPAWLRRRSTPADCTRSSTCTACRRCFSPPCIVMPPPSGCSSTTAQFRTSLIIQLPRLLMTLWSEDHKCENRGSKKYWKIGNIGKENWRKQRSFSSSYHPATPITDNVLRRGDVKSQEESEDYDREEGLENWRKLRKIGTRNVAVLFNFVIQLSRIMVTLQTGNSGSQRGRRRRGDGRRTETLGRLRERRSSQFFA